MASRGVALLLFLSAAALPLISAQTPGTPEQVTAAFEKLSTSPQYGPTVQLIQSNPTLLAKLTASPVIQVAVNDPVGLQYVIGSFGSPVYKEVLSNPQTSAALANSPIMTTILASPANEAPLRVSQLFASAQLPPTGNALTDVNILTSVVTQAAGLPQTPLPAQAPTPASAAAKAGGVQAAG